MRIQAAEWNKRSIFAAQLTDARQVTEVNLSSWSISLQRYCFGAEETEKNAVERDLDS